MWMGHRKEIRKLTFELYPLSERIQPRYQIFCGQRSVSIRLHYVIPWQIGQERMTSTQTDTLNISQIPAE